MDKTIASVTPPPEGTKKPGTVKFTDNTVVNYWPNSKYGARLEPGQTAEVVLEVKTNAYGDQTFLKQWGAVAQKSFGGAPGRPPMSPEERRSIAIQTCLKAGAELHHGSGDLPAMCKTVKALMVLHDGLVTQGATGGI